MKALDFIHVENHKIGGIDPLTPADIGASEINHDHDGRYYTETEVNTKLNDKVDKVTGKGLSTEDYTTNEKNKLFGIDENANNYTHPLTHPASIIVQDSSNRFITDAEKNNFHSIRIKFL